MHSGKYLLALSSSLQECVHFHGEFVGSACSKGGPFVPDVLLWSALLFFTTFLLSSALKHFKTKRYFPTKVCWFPDSHYFSWVSNL